LYRSINQNDLLSDEKYNNFLNKYEIEILDICQKISRQLIDDITFDEFHPIFKIIIYLTEHQQMEIVYLT
jgi:hypothetical protein